MRFNYVLTVLTVTVGLVQAQNSSGNYRISVVDGEGALNSVGTKASREPVIQVSDANHRPVAGAYVEFDAPGTGPGATFANGSTHFATTTNNDGLAVGSKLTNNGMPGAYLLQVRVSFQGRSIGELQIHQTNVPRSISKHLPQGSTSGGSSGEVPGNITLSNNVVGIALGDRFTVNGASTPNNANLLKGTRIQTSDKPTTLYLHDRCEYIMGPHSAVTLTPKVVTLESGSVRARRFGNCRILYGGLWITGTPTSDGVAALTGQNLDVASIGGTVQVVNSAGDIISTVNPGNVSSFGTATVASGASIGVGGSGIPFKAALLLGGSVVALAGLGVATDAMLQPNYSIPPTSP
jgi:hypothetical protein